MLVTYTLEQCFSLFNCSKLKTLSAPFFNLSLNRYELSNYYGHRSLKLLHSIFYHKFRNTGVSGNFMLEIVLKDSEDEKQGF